ncbi:MAG: M50 family metallopeptidase [Patescibacteria group bacterium]|jgi:regulator of sigma E protease
MFITILAFIFVLGILILVHELGHFIVAKMVGVKVEEFSIGFPPRIFSFKKGETKYSIGALIFGGYVKMLGEETESASPRAFNQQKPGKRFAISVAGVIMNFVLAWIILSIGLSIGMTPPVTPSDEVPFSQATKGQVYIVEFLDGSSAQKAGVKLGDQIVKLTKGTDEVTPTTPEQVTDFSGRNKGSEITIKINRNNVPVEQTILLPATEAPLGIGMVNQSIVKVKWYAAPYVALLETWGIVKVIFMFLGSFFSQLFHTGTLSDQVGGPVAIYNLSGDAARAGIGVLFQFIAMLSINLGLINILPIPALDGGRALFIILEKIFGKRILKENIENIIHNIGFAVLMLLVLAVTVKDIIRLFHK